MESWRIVWREAAALLSVEGLRALEIALATDDYRLVQGRTVYPPPLTGTMDAPVEAACLLGYSGWIGDRLQTVGETEEFVGRVCRRLDELTGEPGRVRWLLNPYDEEWTREAMIARLLPEVRRALTGRQVV